MKLKYFLSAAVSLTLVSPIIASGAGLFSDVSDTHPFKGEIESLARSGILKGNPDGKFYSDRSVNRAEFLKMLYVATGRSPKPIYAKCFSDVEVGSWYEAFVCDAASKDHAFVKGYSDGKFRPASPVSRTEALKMVFMLFNLESPDISQDDKNLIKFVDISTSAWYSAYISAAYQNGLLPLKGQSGSRFYPDQELLRGEAAAYIFNAQKALDRQIGMQQAAHSSSSTISSSSSSSASSVQADLMKAVAFPFTDSDRFIKKRPAVYLFTLTEKTNVSIQVSTSGYYPSDVSCRLYLLADEGFSSEYYLGFQETGICNIRATVGAGKYQLQLQPTADSVPFSVTAKKYSGDGNDGFANAYPLKFNQPHVNILEASDLFDWYSFAIDKQTQGIVELSSAEKLECIIYTPLAVDQFGFKGPECNVSYLFGTGDTGSTQYMIGIGRKSGDSIHKIPYTVQFH